MISREVIMISREIRMISRAGTDQFQTASIFAQFDRLVWTDLTECED